jgi:hypothetical protein
MVRFCEKTSVFTYFIEAEGGEADGGDAGGGEADGEEAGFPTAFQPFSLQAFFPFFFLLFAMQNLNLLPEESLLISLCRLEFSEEKKGEIYGLVKRVTDWENFTNAANNHGTDKK